MKKALIFILAACSINSASLCRKLVTKTQNGIVQIIRTNPRAICITYSPKVLRSVRASMIKYTSSQEVRYQIATSSTAGITVTPEDLFMKYSAQFNGVEEKK